MRASLGRILFLLSRLQSLKWGSKFLDLGFCRAFCLSTGCRKTPKMLGGFTNQGLVFISPWDVATAVLRRVFGNFDYIGKSSRVSHDKVDGKGAHDTPQEFGFYFGSWGRLSWRTAVLFRKRGRPVEQNGHDDREHDEHDDDDE